MPIIVISYRRQDSRDITRRVYENLVRRYGKKSVYMDIHSNLPSGDYRAQVRQAVHRALVMLTVIGPRWIGPRPNAVARIFDPDDPVRIEVETALANRRSVMPVLVNGAGMPSEADIPQSLKALPYLHAIEINGAKELSQATLKPLFAAIDKLNATFWLLYVSIYLILPSVLLLLGDYLILFKFDLDPLLLRLAIFAISAALGVGLCLQVGFRTIAAFISGTVVGLVSVIGMLAINSALSSRFSTFGLREVIPSTTREWQEAVEYFLTIALTTLAGNAIARAWRDRRKP